MYFRTIGQPAQSQEELVQKLRAQIRGSKKARLAFQKELQVWNESDGPRGMVWQAVVEDQDPIGVMARYAQPRQGQTYEDAFLSLVNDTKFWTTPEWKEALNEVIVGGLPQDVPPSLRNQPLDADIEGMLQQQQLGPSQQQTSPLQQQQQPPSSPSSLAMALWAFSGAALGVIITSMIIR